ncbi:MAG: DUF6152 family protein [bacterium]|jgi:hypothetical protein|nr:DUF6152 family protein [Betaproteobacteria bacterium]
MNTTCPMPPDDARGALPPLRRAALAAAGAVLLLAAAGASAHHGWSEYDAGKTLTLTGAILESGYDNPHGFVRLKAGDRVWRVILAPPSRMESRGLPRASLKAGVTATVVGYPHRKDAQEMRAERITLEGGQPVELR